VETDTVVALAALEQVLLDLGVRAELGAGVRAAQQVFVGS
jgi:aspartate aminotransferase-like enzyme